MNRDELAHLAEFWEAVAEQATARAAQAKQQLADEAWEEFRAKNTAPTWRIGGYGTIPFATSKPAVVIDDQARYVEWLAKRHPAALRQVPVDAFDKALRRKATALGEPMTEGGEVIPGLRYVEGGRPLGISLRPNEAAKESARQAAQLYLAALDKAGQATVPVEGEPVGEVAA